jgi:hypothetical protein
VCQNKSPANRAAVEAEAGFFRYVDSRATTIRRASDAGGRSAALAPAAAF